VVGVRKTPLLEGAKMQTLPEQFQQAKQELDALKVAYMHGQIDYEIWKTQAQKTAALYNANSKIIAKRYNVKPKLITANKLMH
jgi:hypothetical protein